MCVCLLAIQQPLSVHVGLQQPKRLERLTACRTGSIVARADWTSPKFALPFDAWQAQRQTEIGTKLGQRNIANFVDLHFRSSRRSYCTNQLKNGHTSSCDCFWFLTSMIADHTLGADPEELAAHPWFASRRRRADGSRAKVRHAGSTIKRWCPNRIHWGPLHNPNKRDIILNSNANGSKWTGKRMERFSRWR